MQVRGGVLVREGVQLAARVGGLGLEAANLVEEEEEGEEELSNHFFFQAHWFGKLLKGVCGNRLFCHLELLLLAARCL